MKKLLLVVATLAAAAPAQAELSQRSAGYAEYGCNELGSAASRTEERFRQVYARSKSTPNSLFLQQLYLQESRQLSDTAFAIRAALQGRCHFVMLPNASNPP
jgi:hypothetical protein